MRRRNRTGSTALTSSPSTVMLPESASISRFASRSSVVLPEPEPPTMARNSPSATASVTSSTALTRPPSKLLPTCANAILGGAAVISRDYHTAIGQPSRRDTCLSPLSVELSGRGRYSVLHNNAYRGNACRRMSPHSQRRSRLTMRRWRSVWPIAASTPRSKRRGSGSSMASSSPSSDRPDAGNRRY